MRVRHGIGQDEPQSTWATELDSALRGERQGPHAAEWRELRADVRALAAPMSPAFQARLNQRLAVHTQQPPPGRLARALSGWERLLGGFGQGLLPVTAALLLAGVVAVIAVAPWHRGASRTPAHPVPSTAVTTAGPGLRSAGQLSSTSTSSASTPSSRAGAAAPSATASPAAGPASGPPAAPGRVQQLGGSLTLATSNDTVQHVSDRVAEVAVANGGYVVSSHVQVEQEGPSEATLQLQLPSATLTSTLAQIARLASVRAESQSVQDITDEYHAAQRRVQDTEAERRALLSSLSKAGTQAQVESLTRQISLASAAVGRARVALAAISRQASDSEVQVSIVGQAQPVHSEGLTVDRGLHDAGRVLTVTLVIALIALAAALPLALVLAILARAHSIWLDHRRERALDRR